MIKELLIGNSIGSDVRFGSSKSLLKIEDTLVYNATIKDHSELKQFNLNETETLIKFDGSIDGFAKINDNWIVIGQYQHGPQELYLIKDHEVSKLSNFNDLSEYYVAKPELFEFESNNDTLTGYVLLPENFDSEKSYPAILDIHGGPKTVYGSIFYHEMQVWASMGYVVFFTNPTWLGWRWWCLLGHLWTLWFDWLRWFDEPDWWSVDQISKHRSG